MTNSVADKWNSILKVTGYWILFLALLIPVTSQSGAIFLPHVHDFAFGIFGTAIALFVTWIFIRSEKRTFADYNLAWKKDTLPKFVKGLAIGMSGYALITLILVLFGGLIVQKSPEAISPWVWFWYLSILPASLTEEIAFRSYPFLKLESIRPEANSINGCNCVLIRTYHFWMEFFGSFFRTRNMGINIRGSSNQV